jgi:tetratricopeptide (TPR) repeat protein
VLLDLDRKGEAASSFLESLAAYRGLAADNSADVGIRKSLAIVIVRVGDSRLADGDHEGALELYREALDIREASVAKEPDSAQAKRALSLNLYKIGNALRESGDTAAALAHLERALEMYRALFAADPQDARARRDLALTLRTVGDFHFRVARYREAETHFREALAMYSDMKARDQLRAPEATALAELGTRIAACDGNGRP